MFTFTDYIAKSFSVSLQNDPIDLEDASTSDSDDIKAGYVLVRVAMRVMHADLGLLRSPPTKCAIMTASVIEDKADELLKRDYSAVDVPKLQ